MQIDLTGRTAVVTGAGHGIGLAVTTALVEAGATVYGGARTVSPELRKVTPHTLEVDLATPDGPGRLVAEALAEFGGLDVLVNNVGGGVMHAAGFLDIPDEVWTRTFELNLLSAVRATRAALPSLVERRGTIVNIGSVNATMPDPHLAHYGAAKAALANLGGALSEEFAPQGVRVNTISPGPVRTRVWSRPQIAARLGITTEEFLERVPKLNGLSTGSMIEPAEIADLVVLLASGRVPSITGTELSIDAGMIKTL